VSVTKCTFKCSNTIADKGGGVHAGGSGDHRVACQNDLWPKYADASGPKDRHTRPWPRRSMYEGYAVRFGGWGQKLGGFSVILYYN